MEMTTDMLAPEEIFAPAVPAAPAELNPLALLTIKPEEYVAQVFAPFRAKLTALKAEADAIHFIGPTAIDITTTAGMAVAVKMRAAFRDDVRLSVEKTKVARKAPILQIGRLLDSTYNEIVAEVTPYEGKFDAVIKAEEKRKADIKAAKERAEAERIGTIKAAIEAIRALPDRAAGKSSEELRALLERVAARMITAEEFDQFVDEAQDVLDAAGLALVAMYESTQKAEQAAAEAEAAHLAEIQRLADERAELARQRAEADERERVAKAEAARVAAEQAAEAKRLADLAAEQVAELQKLRDAEAARVRAEQAERDRVAAETKRQLNAQQAEIAAGMRALEAQRAAAAKAEQDRIDAEALRQRIIDDHAEALPMNAQFDADREAERVRLQALADEALAAGRERAADEHAAGLPAGALGADSMTDLAIGDEADDEEIISMVATAFDLSILEAIDRLSRIDFDAARTLAEAA